ncbi:MAG: beta-ketoacyl-[acyl-carrier-protein] synthase I [Gammaproteobacteria bacterium RIFCSPLOWO2_02_FULL_52_10]|nr:MAG: beta-ketoacyl-[acyl-carrier-protein] synthase I [Gammaproteobacteria bacterium RIFCSPLOWO2_02_FULL_52_10]
MQKNKRVVITGLGIKSSIGNSKDEVIASLQQARSGIVFCEEYRDLGFRSHVYGPIRLDLVELIDRKLKRFMGDAAGYCYLAMQDAITDASLEEPEISNPRTGLIVGTGGSSTENMLLATDTLRQKGARKVGATLVPRVMSSTASACLGVAFHIKGVSYSISSACTTSLHCIGNAYELIQLGKQDIVFAGGGDEVHWTQSILFDAMGALSSKYNDNPATASRPFDVTRDGFVISGGGGIVVVEELEHALARDAHIYAEIVGYGATCDGADMVKPSGEGAIRSMRMALESVDKPINYINAHATSTPAGDTSELIAIKTVFGGNIPWINSTKALTGHGLGAAGVTEAIYSLLMMENNFICISANLSTPEVAAQGMPIVRERIDNVNIQAAMSNSFGFGGTNGTLVFQKPD